MVDMSALSLWVWIGISGMVRWHGSLFQSRKNVKIIFYSVANIYIFSYLNLFMTIKSKYFLIKIPFPQLSRDDETMFPNWIWMYHQKNRYLCHNEMDWDKFRYFYPVDKNINQFAAWYNFDKFNKISQIKWGASSQWSFDPNSIWGSTESMAIGKTHPTLFLDFWIMNLSWGLKLLSS